MDGCPINAARFQAKFDDFDRRVIKIGGPAGRNGNAKDMPDRRCTESVAAWHWNARPQNALPNV